MMANRPEPLAASVVPHESAHVPSRRGDGDGALLMFDCAAPGASWHDRVMKAEYDAALVQLADEKSSPPPLEVYESESGPDSGADFIFRSGAELLRDSSHVSQWGSQGDGECAFEDDRGPESGERIMHQLFGRMHAKQPRLLSRGPLPLCVRVRVSVGLSVGRFFACTCVRAYVRQICLCVLRSGAREKMPWVFGVSMCIHGRRCLSLSLLQADIRRTNDMRR